ncbi:hypothetical protein JM946_02360 [Steroidobacter sp. S1-65]|uniref:HEPN AbiJ-N-terminal domain-containing protein n=1 Tax=Steroidobacter gossypii TaxID=2805490 RepID=A0ABS1WRG4_9GAMM|nr:hypothetical protein [Steroidobacter gossypii]MBM0103563.1 hypothetical protein [Steroidobacter gossypii]
MRFSQRIGKRPVTTVLQTEGMDDDLRSSLWNILDLYIWQREGFMYAKYGSGPGDIDAFSMALWFHFFKRPMDARPNRTSKVLDEIRSFFLDANGMRFTTS